MSADIFGILDDHFKSAPLSLYDWGSAPYVTGMRVKWTGSGVSRDLIITWDRERWLDKLGNPFEPNTLSKLWIIL